MKTVMLAAAALIATPLFAQTTPSDSTTMQAPASQTGSTMSATPTGTSDPAPMAGASSTTASNGGATTGMADSSTPMAANGKLPWCRAGQYNNCREHENAKGQGVGKR